MNMISTGAFQTEMDVSSKQQELIKKLTAVWEKKNSKAARVGGVSLMALSLAACGDDDDTPFSQADVDAAVAASEADFIAEINDAIGSNFTGEEESAVVLATIQASDNGPLEVQVAQALVGQQQAEATAAAALVAQQQAEAQAAAALVAQAAAEAQVATAQAATEAAQAAQATAEANLATVQAQYDALVAPKALTATTATDNLIGGTGNDTYTGAAGTVAAADRFTDTSSTDSDTLNITHSTAPGAFTATNVENINITLNNLGALAVDAANITGASSLTVTRGDVVVGGATLTGNKAVRVDNLDSSGVTSVTVGAGTTTVDINSAAADLAGHVLNLNNASGAITVDGAATINASTSTDVRIDAVTNTAVAETGKASVINAAAAGRVDTHADLTGSITIDAPAATAINVNDAQGGATITASTTSTADSTITVADVDSSGLTITTGTGSATASEKQISLVLDGTAATTDTATISGAGVIALDIDGATAGNIDTLTLSGNGAAVTYNLDAPNSGTFTSATKSGTQSVTLAGDVSDLTGAGVTITGIDVVDINAEGGGDQAIDTSLFSGVGKIDLGIDNGGGNAVTVVSGSTVEITADRAGAMDFDFSAAGGGDMTIVAGDDNGASAAVGTIAIGGALNAAAAAATTVGTVTIEASLANLTATSTVLNSKQNLVITGDEDVTLGAVTADSVSAVNSTGIINMTSQNNVDVVSLGSGNDILVINDATGDATGNGDTVSTGGGTDTLTISDTANAASFDTGDGNDTINVDDANSNYVVVGGAGTDNFATAANLISTLVGGDGSDTITIDAGGARTFGATFAMSSIEKLNITAANAAVQMSGAQLAGSGTLEITGTGTNDTFVVQSASTATAAKSIDGTNVTLATGSDATIQYKGAVGVDTISGGVAAEQIFYSAGNDTITGGGTGVDTLVIDNTATNGSTITVTGSAASTGLVINLSDAAVTSATIVGATGDFIANSLASVGAGQGAYIYNAAAASNNASVTAIEGMENVTSTDSAGIEYVVGSSGNNSIATGAGADHILAGAGADTVTGGGGNDTIDLGSADASIDTVVFENTAGNNGLDTIANFGQTQDVLNIDAFLNATAMNAALTANPGGGTAIDDDVSLLVDIAGGQDITTASGLGTAVAGGGEYANIDMGANKTAVIVTAASNAAGQTQHVFFATSNGAGLITAVEVAQLTSLDIDTFIAADFNI